MNRIFFTLFYVIMSASSLFAGQSVITESEGYACMGDDKSRKDTEQLAVKDAKRKATEYAVTYIQSETHVKDMALEKDLMSAYANAQVKVVRELEKGWYKDAASGDCYKAKLQVEVVPDEKAIAAAANKGLADDPSAPLSVKVWTDRKECRQGERFKIYIKGNKPFFGRIVYRDAGGNLVQLLPNPYRQNNYFNGGTTYEFPSGEDKFDLEVCPPFGTENVTVYASTVPLGDLETASVGGVYAIKSKPQDVGAGTRGLKIVEKGSGGKPVAAEFAEAEAVVRTGK
jgi:Domain of unknown function (DUF4384)